MKVLYLFLSVHLICIINLNGNQKINIPIDSDEELMLEMLGYMTVHRNGLKELGFGENEANAIARGLKKALKEDIIDPNYQDKMSEFQAFIEKRIKDAQSIREEKQVVQLEDNLAKGKKFLDGLLLDKSVKSTDSGLYYKILKKGRSNYAEKTDTVRVHYKGTRIDGTVFDSSYNRGQPSDFSLEAVVPGFAEGLTKVGEGGQIILFIPSNLAYGDKPRSGGIIQPGDTLIFVCELIKINP